MVLRIGCRAVERRRLTVKFDTEFSLVFETLLVLFPLFAAFVFSTLFAINGPIFFTLQSLVVATLFFKHDAVCLVLRLLSLFVLATLLFTTVSTCFTVSSPTLFVLASLFII